MAFSRDFFLLPLSTPEWMLKILMSFIINLAIAPPSATYFRYQVRTLISSVILGLTCIAVVYFGFDTDFICFIGLPYTLGYFVADCLRFLFFGKNLFPEALAHHIIMIACWFPLGNEISTNMYGAGSTSWARALFASGGLAEIPVVFLQIRVMLMIKLEKHHWIWTLNTIFLLCTYFYYRIYNYFFLILQIWERRPLFIEQEIMPVWWLGICGYAFTCLASTGWYLMLLKSVSKGIYFIPKTKQKSS